MAEGDARAALDALIRDRREDYAALSRLIGRNPAYIQQYVKRGSPRRLAEADRRTLARYFGVDEALLGAEPPEPAEPPYGGRERRRGALVAVPRLALGASAGPGRIVGEERARPAMAFPPDVLRTLGAGRTEALSLIQVEGESMQPTLADGDDILVDRDDGSGRLRDGIYVLRIGDVLLVKRIALMPGGGLAVRSDNPLSPDLADVDPASLAVIGRVIWTGRRVR